MHCSIYLAGDLYYDVSCKRGCCGVVLVGACAGERESVAGEGKHFYNKGGGSRMYFVRPCLPWMCGVHSSSSCVLTLGIALSNTNSFIWTTETTWLGYKFYLYKRSNHEESFCAVKINHKNLVQ